MKPSLFFPAWAIAFFVYAFPCIVWFLTSVAAVGLDEPAGGTNGHASTMKPLAGTLLLEDMADDPAAEMVAGIDRLALRLLAEATDKRQAVHWREPADMQPNLDYLRQQLGLSYLQTQWDSAIHPVLYEAVALVGGESILRGETPQIKSIRWPVTRHPAPQLQNVATVWGEGLLLEPRVPNDHLVVIIPDADESVEAVAGLSASQTPGRQLVRQLVNSGCTVVVMQLVSRDVMSHGNVELTRREYLHRAAFELGLTLTGYEVATIQRLLDQLGGKRNTIIGFGEGARVALWTAAIDQRVHTTIAAGYFGPREQGWQEPLDRNLFGVYNRIGDAELAALIAPRPLWIDAEPQYRVELATRGGAPSSWQSPTRDMVSEELKRLPAVCAAIGHSPTHVSLLEHSIATQESIQRLLKALAIEGSEMPIEWSLLSDEKAGELRAARIARLVDAIDMHNQAMLEECDYQRTQRMNIGLERDDLSDGSNRLETASLEAYTTSIERYRQVFAEQVIGELGSPLLNPNARSRQAYAGDGWEGYDVVLDVVPDLLAYGVLLVPNDLAAGEQRPVVVCQHGLEGRPQDTMLGDNRSYHDFAAKLAERGFIVFAPQNPYIGQDRFRTLQRKLNPTGRTLFSVIAAQHKQIVSWLSELDFVDPDRIAFYGLSYGGKSAMRLPALIPEYCLSICSADFNDWVWKNASTRAPYSYVGTGEYEIFEFDLGHRFNYAEMAALIAPRPFMVERGHFDGVAPDDRVAKEFARVRFLYAARLGIADRCHIEWFVGPHTIHGKDSFDFLHTHLRWPQPK